LKRIRLQKTTLVRQKLVIAKTGSTDIALELPEDAINSFTSSANVDRMDGE
jgi:hypothetical protein